MLLEYPVFVVVVEDDRWFGHRGLDSGILSIGRTDENDIVLLVALFRVITAGSKSKWYRDVVRYE